VMAHESFERPEIAAVMNRLFVNIKVDREERPDLDVVYQQALAVMGQQGGWPLTMFLTPEREPFWGGTYFPPEPRHGRPGFVQVLEQVAELWRTGSDRIASNRAAISQALHRLSRPEAGAPPSIDFAERVARAIAERFDTVHGGLGGAPKFPQAPLLRLIWDTALRTGDPTLRHRIQHTLGRTSQGGIYDHLGGGFARYAVDAYWLVPHFEKMLYDNAQLLELLAVAFARTGKPLYRQRAAETVGWLAREMTRPEGAFAASLDAESEGEEGKFYVWSHDEIERVLGPENAAFFAAHYDVSPEGNFEGHNILNMLSSLPRSKDDDAKLAMLRSLLHEERSKRIRPSLDDKVLADWNGLMIAALANAGTLFSEPTWVEQAARAFRFIAQSMTRGDRLGHSWRDGRLLFPGLASDFACMIKAALALFEATGDPAFLERAVAWQRALDRHYANAEIGGYYLTADDAEGLVVRPHSIMDDATPNPNAVTAQNLVRLAALTGDDTWRSATDRLFDRLIPIAAENLFGHMALLNALDFRLRPTEIVVTGTGERADALVQAALKVPSLTRTVLRARSADALPASHPAQPKVAAAHEPAAFLCVGTTCSLPIVSASAIAEAVSSPRSPPAP
ncbi:MAG: thioredoxin domain-containing protein, partial [Xanthobacteraceae bacterium]